MADAIGIAPKSGRLWPILVAVVAVAALGVFGYVLLQGGFSRGAFNVKFKNTELNFSVDSDEVGVEDLIGKMLEGRRAEIVAAYLEKKGKLYSYGSAALVERIKADEDDSPDGFAEDLRDIATLRKGPFESRPFVDLSKSSAADDIAALDLDDPVVKRLRTMARNRTKIFQDRGRQVQIGLFPDHPRGIAASCRAADFYGERVQVFSSRAFINLQVARSFDCDMEGFDYRDTPSLFLQIGKQDALGLFGRQVSPPKTQPALVVIQPPGFQPAPPVNLASRN